MGNQKFVFEKLYGELTVHFSGIYDMDVASWLAEKEDPEAYIKALLRKVYTKETTVTPAILRKLFCGKKIDSEKLNKWKWEAGEYEGCIELEKVYLDPDGNEFTYHMNIDLNSDGRIYNISPLTCEKLLGDDARGSGYRNVHPDSYQYERVRDLIKGAIVDEADKQN